MRRNLHCLATGNGHTLYQVGEEYTVTDTASGKILFTSLDSWEGWEFYTFGELLEGVTVR